MKNIRFSHKTDELSKWVYNPVPAIKNLPDWYKNMESFHGGKMKMDGPDTNSTAKRCMPMLDGLTAGYHINLDFDVYIEKDGQMSWSAEGLTVFKHYGYQIEGMPIPPEYIPMVFKWENPYIVRTPKGYSTLFISPLLHFGNPFYCFPGIVDTDTWDMSVNFPFLLRKDFTGMIKQGTPMIQAIPFKRDDWKMDVSERFEDEDPVVNQKKHRANIINYYRNKYWKRKKFS